MQLVDKVYDWIVERILDGRLKPGEVLNWRDLASKLKVSVSPVGGAVRQLELEGLLETIPRKGTRVPDIRMEDAWGVLVMRVAIECEAARIFCGGPVASEKARLLKLAREADKTSSAASELIRADARFHHELVSLTNSSFIVGNFDKIIRRNLLLAGVFFDGAGTRASHVTLLKELETGDPEKASAVMRSHIMYGKDLIARAMSSGIFKAEPEERKGRRIPHLRISQKRLSRSMEALAK